MSETMTVFLAGGGTGGHLYPGIAVAQQLRQRLPKARLIFLCTTREIDKIILESTGFEFIPQPIVPLVKSPGGLLRFAIQWRATAVQLRQLLREHKPKAVLGLGGYAAEPAVRMAAKRGIPTAIINPDVIPGKANVMLMKRTQAVCCQFAETAQHVSTANQAKLRITGCPIREELTQPSDRPAAIQRLGLRADLQTLVVTGASLGAATVNEAALELLQQLPMPGWQVLHLAGRDHAAKVRECYKPIGIPATVVDFTPAMADVWAVADLCISRSGASSCAELTACGVPSLLMPYPYHKDMHQRANAQVLVAAGAAILIDDEKDAVKNAGKLCAAIKPLLDDPTRRAAMSAAARKIGRPDAAAAVAEVVLSLLE
jgi:UDP-N-acetylglucosamine--N-acetylmuramyl-(pentapeptide) pyrophosphoryl-undecaprenol N-acetylglucosamine transferase